MGVRLSAVAKLREICAIRGRRTGTCGQKPCTLAAVARANLEIACLVTRGILAVTDSRHIEMYIDCA